jgi:hypothetical protein
LASAAKLTPPLTDANAVLVVVAGFAASLVVVVVPVEAGVAVLTWNKDGLAAVVAAGVVVVGGVVVDESTMGGGNVFETVDGVVGVA